MEGPEHLQHIAILRWVETASAGSKVALGKPTDETRADMYKFVKEHPKQAYAISQNDNKFAFLEAVNASVQYVKTLPDSTKADNLLTLPRF